MTICVGKECQLSSLRRGVAQGQEDVREHLCDELLARGLLAVKQPQAGQQSSLGGRVRGQLCLLVHVDHHGAQVAAAAALAGFEERLRDAGQDVDGGVPVLGLDISRGSYPGLLLGFVEVAICNLLLQPGDDLVDFAGHGGRRGRESAARSGQGAAVRAQLWELTAEGGRREAIGMMVKQSW